MVIKNVKNLKTLCLQKIVDTYKIDTYITYKTYFDCLLSAYRKLGPSLSIQIFSKVSGNKNIYFGKFLWFLHYFVWNPNTLQLYMSHHELQYDNNKLLINWIKEYYHQYFINICEVRFIGCNYLDRQMYFIIMNNFFKNSPKHKVLKLDPKDFTYEEKMPLKTEENLNKLLKLTVMNCDLLDYHYSHQSIPAFFDLDKGTAFSFKQSIQILGFPALECSAKLHHELVSEKFDLFALLYEKWHQELTMPENKKACLSIIRFSEKKKLTNTDRLKSKRNFETFINYLNNFTLIEEAVLSLLDISNKQKKSIADNLNENLKILKLVFFQPISFLLYIGKRFKHLQKLDVAFLVKKSFQRHAKGNELEVKHTKGFDKLNNMNLVVFENLKSFSLFCNNVKETYPLLLDTILTVLKGCQKTLTFFELKFCSFPDVKEIVNFISSTNMALKHISFYSVDFLTDKNVMQIVKANVNDKLLLQIRSCKNVTCEGINAVLNHITQNNLKMKVEFFNAFRK